MTSFKKSQREPHSAYSLLIKIPNIMGSFLGDRLFWNLKMNNWFYFSQAPLVVKQPANSNGFEGMNVGGGCHQRHLLPQRLRLPGRELGANGLCRRGLVKRHLGPRSWELKSVFFLDTIISRHITPTMPIYFWWKLAVGDVRCRFGDRDSNSALRCASVVWVPKFLSAVSLKTDHDFCAV